MGKLSFGKGQSRSDSNVVKLEFAAENDLDGVERTVSRLSALLMGRAGLLCYVLGEGGMPTGTYERLSGMAGVTVVREGSCMPQALFFLCGIVASECGLVRLDDVSALPAVFGTLIEQSMAIVFVMPSDEGEAFVARSGKRGRDSGFDHGVRAIANHVVYLVDADNYESKTGVVEYVSCGIACEDDILDVFNRADGEPHAAIAV
jgi:hypothetical protein